MSKVEGAGLAPIQEPPRPPPHLLDTGKIPQEGVSLLPGPPDSLGHE